MSHVLGIGTALPAYQVKQEQVQELVRSLFSDLPGLDRLIKVFENTGIQSRYIAQPVQWYNHNHPFTEKNQAWFEGALALSLEASQQALQVAGLQPQQISGVVLVSTTGIATPSLDAYLIQALNIPLSATRVPLWGLGCAGGAAGLARAAELSRLQQKPVLLVAVELCSLTFIAGDKSKSNLVATSLFADGAAAVVVGQGAGPEVVGSFSQLLPNSYDIMGWDMHPYGLQVRFAQSIPALVENQLPELLEAGLQNLGFTHDQIGLHILHPGGAKVLAAYRQALGCSDQSLDASWSVLRRCGNMSSPTVLFVLKELLQVQPAGQLGLLMALGPGFSADGVVLRW